MLNSQSLSPQVLQYFQQSHILDIGQFGREELDTLMQVAEQYRLCLERGEVISDLQGKIMASLFFEPSTRTRLSFESAMLRLGGQVIGVTESPQSPVSSAAKGETLYDSVKIVSNLCDVLICRSPLQGARHIMAAASCVPVINAGDGAGEHPTQALLDLYTIQREKGCLSGLTYALMGDLKHGRTVHSLAEALTRYQVARLILASPASLRMPKPIVAHVRQCGIEVVEVDNLEQALAEGDVLYMTRVQRERFTDVDQYEQVKDMFIIREEHIPLFKEGALLLHPLPRLNEIAPEVDQYSGAAYFRQAANGLPVRMALLALVLGAVS